MGDAGWHISVGFLSCLAAVELVIIILLFLDRRRKVKQIYELSMLSLESTANHLTRQSSSEENKPSKCPARSAFPELAILRGDPSTPNCTSNRGRSEVAQNTRPNEASTYNGAHEQSNSMHCETDIPTVLFSDYAEVFGSQNRDKFERQTVETRTNFVHEQNEKCEAAAVPEQDISPAKDSRDLLRNRTSIGTEKSRNSNSPRYSLVRFDRLSNPKSTRSSQSMSESLDAGDYAKITSKFSSTPRISLNNGDATIPDLLDEISLATAITFENDEQKPSKNMNRKQVGRSETFSSTGTGVYEPIEVRRPPSSVASHDESDNDLTEVSELNSCSESDMISPLSPDAHYPWSPVGKHTLPQPSIVADEHKDVPEVLLTSDTDKITVLVGKSSVLQENSCSSTENDEAYLL